MGTSSSALLRTMALAREYTADATGTVEALVDIIARLDALSTALADQHQDVGEIASALIVMQATLADMVSTLATHTTKLDALAVTQAAHTTSLANLATAVADLPAMKIQIQAIYDAVVTP